jgi:hypothetical protein
VHVNQSTLTLRKSTPITGTFISFIDRDTDINYVDEIPRRTTASPAT